LAPREGAEGPVKEDSKGLENTVDAKRRNGFPLTQPIVDRVLLKNVILITSFHPTIDDQCNRDD
jgi:hypothetical protein